MSIKACSEEYMKNHDNSFMVFPSDTVYYRYNKSICYYLITINIRFHFERVYVIDKDYFNSTNHLEIVKLIINPLYSLSRFKIN